MDYHCAYKAKLTSLLTSGFKYPCVPASKRSWQDITPLCHNCWRISTRLWSYRMCWCWKCLVECHHLCKIFIYSLSHVTGCFFSPKTMLHKRFVKVCRFHGIHISLFQFFLQTCKVIMEKYHLNAYENRWNNEKMLEICLLVPIVTWENRSQNNVSELFKILYIWYYFSIWSISLAVHCIIRNKRLHSGDQTLMYTWTASVLSLRLTLYYNIAYLSELFENFCYTASTGKDLIKALILVLIDINPTYK